MNAYEYYKSAKHYFDSDKFRNSTPEEQEKLRNDVDNVLNKKIQAETSGMSNEQITEYNKQFSDDYVEPNPYAGVDRDAFVQKVYDLKNSDAFNNLNTEAQAAINQKAGETLRKINTAQGRPSDNVDYNARKAAYENLVQNFPLFGTGEDNGEEEQPKEAKDITWGNALKSAGKSLAKGVMEQVPNIVGAAAAGADMLGGGETELGEFGTAMSDAMSRNIEKMLPAEQKPLSSIEDVKDRSFGQNVLSFLDEAPRQTMTFVLPALLGYGSASVAKAAKLGKYGPKIAKIANKITPQTAQRIGAFIGSGALEAQDINKSIYQEKGYNDSPVTTLLGSTAAGAMESLVPGGLEFAKLGLSSATREAMRQAAKGGFKQFFKYMLGRTGKSVLEEMTTEGIQTVIEKMTANYAVRGDTGFTQKLDELDRAVKANGVEGAWNYFKKDPDTYEVFSSAVLGGLTGGLTEGTHSLANMVSYNTSDVARIDDAMRARRAAIENNDKVAFEKANKELADWAKAGYGVQAAKGMQEAIFRSLQEMNDPDATQQDLNEAYEILSNLTPQQRLQYIAILMENGYTTDELFNKRNEEFRKYCEQKHKVLQGFNPEAETRAEKTDDINLVNQFMIRGTLSGFANTTTAQIDEILPKIRSNISNLNEQLTRTTDPNEQKLIKSIIADQQNSEETLTAKREEIAQREAQAQPTEQTQVQTAEQPQTQTAEQTQTLNPDELREQLKKEMGVQEEQADKESYEKLLNDEEDLFKRKQQVLSQRPEHGKDELNGVFDAEKADIAGEGRVEQNIGKPMPNNTGFFGKKARLKAQDIETTCTYAVVEAESLKHDPNNSRLRNERATSKEQISHIAKNLDPDLLLDNGIMANDGPLVINSDMIVESGNGRLDALLEAYNDESGNGEYSGTTFNPEYGNANRYREQLILRANEFGISANQVQQMKHPVLVRIRDNDANVNAKEFGIKANVSRQMNYSASEQALMDGAAIRKYLPEFNAISNLSAESNRAFVNHFLSEVCAPSELNKMYSADMKELSAEGRQRIINALLATAYNDSGILGALTETTIPEVQTILDGLVGASADGAKLQGEIQKGEYFDIDLSEDLASAIRAIRDIQLNEGMKAMARNIGIGETYLSQGVFENDGLSLGARLFIAALGNLKSKTAITEFMRDCYEEIRAKGNPNQLNLDGSKTPQPKTEEIIAGAIRRSGLMYKDGRSLADDIERYKKGPHALINDEAQTSDKKYSLNNENDYAEYSKKRELNEQEYLERRNKAEAAYKEKSDRINSDMLDELSSAGSEGYDQETIDRLADEETQAREERDKELNSMPSMPTVDEKRKSDADYEKSLAADEDLESLINSLGEDDNYKSQNFGNGTIDINTLNSMAEDWNKRISSESGISIEVYESPEAYNEKNGLTGNNAVPESAEGFNEYGKVVLFASNIRSEEHARRKLMHEVIGHSGIKRLLGGNYKYALAGLVDLAKRDKHVRQIFKMVANRYKGLIRNVDRGNIFGTDQERAKSKKDYIFEEVGAFLSEEHKNSGGPVRRFLDRIKLGVRDRLRNWGFNVASSDLELSRLFESGKDAVAKGNSWENAEYNNVDDFGRRMSLDDGTKIIRTHKKQKPKTQVEPNLENRPSKPQRFEDFLGEDASNIDFNPEEDQDFMDAAKELSKWFGDMLDQRQGKKRFSLSAPAEATDKLIAIHNLNAQDLLKTLRLGGLVMPSIAVVKSDMGHDNFGPISVVFNRFTIDPQNNPDNKIYDSDAWTPTFPSEAKTKEEALELMKNQKPTARRYDLDRLSRVAVFRQLLGYNEFDSIESMKDDSNRLGRGGYLTPELDRKYYNLVSDITEQNVRGEFDDYDIAAVIQDPLIEFAKSDRTIDDLRQAFRKYNVTDQQINDLYSIYSSIAKGSTRYFEAKPRRIVGFEEIQKVILPVYTDEELLTELDKHGIPYDYYEQWDEEDRLAKINAVEGARFSLSSNDNDEFSRLVDSLDDDGRTEVSSKNSFDEMFSGESDYLGTDEFGGPRFSIATGYKNRDKLKETAQKYEKVAEEFKHKGFSQIDVDDFMDQSDRILKFAEELRDSKEYPMFNEVADAMPLLYEMVNLSPRAKPRQVFSYVQQNSDFYVNTGDLSSVCKKRRPLDALFAQLFEDGAFSKGLPNPGQIVALQNVLRKHQLEVACGLCYVDSKRYDIGNFLRKFVLKWNAAVSMQKENPKKFKSELDYVNSPYKDKDGEWHKQRNNIYAKIIRYLNNCEPSDKILLSGAKLMSSYGQDELAKNHPEIYGLFNSAGGTSRPKNSHTERPYNGDIENGHPATWDREKVYNRGGFRMQSFSDFEAHMWLDLLQAIQGLSARKLPAHCYTKEAEEIELFGRTGIKFNMSLVYSGKGVVEVGRSVWNKLQPFQKAPVVNGKYYAYTYMDGRQFDTKSGKLGTRRNTYETFDPERAWELRKRDEFNGNVGTIAVGVTDEHIECLLADDNIDMVIPYHVSGLNPAVASLRQIEGYENYTDVQNTRKWQNKKDRDGNVILDKNGNPVKELVALTGADFHFNFNEDLRRTGDPKKTVQNYLEDCERRGFVPKFDKWADNPGYYKMLTDFRLYDNQGNYAPQRDVELKLPEDFQDKVKSALQNEKNYLAKLYKTNEDGSFNRLNDNMVGYRYEVRPEIVKEAIDALKNPEKYVDPETYEKLANKKYEEDEDLVRLDIDKFTSDDAKPVHAKGKKKWSLGDGDTELEDFYNDFTSDMSGTESDPFEGSVLGEPDRKAQTLEYNKKYWLKKFAADEAQDISDATGIPSDNIKIKRADNYAYFDGEENPDDDPKVYLDYYGMTDDDIRKIAEYYGYEGNRDDEDYEWNAGQFINEAMSKNLSKFIRINEIFPDDTELEDFYNDLTSDEPRYSLEDDDNVKVIRTKKKQKPTKTTAEETRPQNKGITDEDLANFADYNPLEDPEFMECANELSKWFGNMLEKRSGGRKFSISNVDEIRSDLNNRMLPDNSGLRESYNDGETDEYPEQLRLLDYITAEGENLADIDHLLASRQRTPEAEYILNKMAKQFADAFPGKLGKKLAFNCLAMRTMLNTGEYKKNILKPVSIDEITKAPVQDIFGLGEYADTEDEQKYENYIRSNRDYSESQKEEREKGRAIHDRDLYQYTDRDELMADIENPVWERRRFSINEEDDLSDVAEEFERIGEGRSADRNFKNDVDEIVDNEHPDRNYSLSKEDLSFLEEELNGPTVIARNEITDEDFYEDMRRELYNWEKPHEYMRYIYNEKSNDKGRQLLRNVFGDIRGKASTIKFFRKHPEYVELFKKLERQELGIDTGDKNADYGISRLKLYTTSQKIVDKVNNSYDFIDHIGALSILDRYWNHIIKLDSDIRKPRYSLVEDPQTISQLEDDDKIVVYRAMCKIGNEYYPPMATMWAENGKRKLTGGQRINAWYKSDERPDFIIGYSDGDIASDQRKYYRTKADKARYGNDAYYGKVNIIKDNGKPTNVAYNPYWHSSLSLVNDQFKEYIDRNNLVVVACEISKRDLAEGYKAKFAKDSIGAIEGWKSGDLRNALGKAGYKQHRTVYLSRYIKLLGEVDNEKIADEYEQMVRNTGVKIPRNVVPAKVLDILLKRGVAIGHDTRTFGEKPDGTNGKRNYSLGSALPKLSNEDTDTITSRAVDALGTTDVWSGAGYLMPDGRLLDFSESNDGGTPGVRTLDHRNISMYYDTVLEPQESHTDFMTDFMKRGNIRCQQNGVDMITEPTSEQLAQIRKAVSDNNGRFYVDFSDEIGNNIYSVYYNNASPSRVSNDIRRYYQEGIKPQGDGFNDYQEDRMYSIAEGKPRKNIATPDAVDKDLIHYKRPPKVRPDSPKVGYIYNITDRPTDHWNGSGFEHGVYSRKGLAATLQTHSNPYVVTEDHKNMRQMTSLEFCRLMGLSDEEAHRLDGIPRKHIEFMMGNSIVVPVVESVIKDAFDAVGIKHKPTLLSLFSGVGTPELALEHMGGYDLVAFSEINPKSIRGYKAMHGATDEQNLGDITKVDPKKLPHDTDLVFYGFPCQDLSPNGSRQGFVTADGYATRSGLFTKVAEILGETQPKIAIAENSSNLMNKNYWPIFKEAIESKGYNVYGTKLNAAEFGVPQNRNRTFAVAIRKDLDDGSFKFTVPEKHVNRVPLSTILESDEGKEIEPINTDIIEAKHGQNPKYSLGDSDQREGDFDSEIESYVNNDSRRFSLNRQPTSIEEYKQMRALPLPPKVEFSSVKELYDIYKKNYLGQTITTPDGYSMTFKPGHFFRLVCHNDGSTRKGFISKANSSEEAIRMIENNEVEPNEISGFEKYRGKSILRFKEILEDPDFYYYETKTLNDGSKRNTVTYGRKYSNIKKSDGFLAVSMNLGNGKIGPLSFHPKKFNDKVLNNDTLVWNIVSNPTDTKSIIGETVGRQSDDHKNILAQRNDLSTNNYDTSISDANNNILTQESPERNYSLSNDGTSSDTDSQNENIGDVIRKRYGSAVTDEQIQAFKDLDYKTPDLFDEIPSPTEEMKNQAVELTTAIEQAIDGFLGDTRSINDRKKPDYLWHKAHQGNEIETEFEITRRNKIEKAMKARDEEDRLILQHLDADRNFLTTQIRKHTKPGAFQDWLLKKTARILGPFQAMKPVESILYTIAENLMWDENKQQMVIAPQRSWFEDKDHDIAEYRYDDNRKIGTQALKYFEKLNPEFRNILIERAKVNNKFREDFINRVIPLEKAKLQLALFARRKMNAVSDKNIESASRVAFAHIDKLQGIVDQVDYNNLRADFDYLNNLPLQHFAINSDRINKIIRNLTGNSGATTKMIQKRLHILDSNKGIYGYAHHHALLDPLTKSGGKFNALGQLSHPWLETMAADRKGRTGEVARKSLLIADVARNEKEATAEAANRWMEDVENQRGIPVDSLTDKKIFPDGKLPEGYEKRQIVVANFGKWRGKDIYLPDEIFDTYQLIKSKGDLSAGMKPFSEALRFIDNANSQINQALLYAPSKAARDLIAVPFALVEFMRDWSIRHPNEASDAIKAVFSGIKNSVSPEYWQSHTPESLGEYSESLTYDNHADHSRSIKWLNSFGNIFQKSVPAGSTLAAVLGELNLSGAADIPLKRIMTTVGETLADKRGLKGIDRQRFIYDMVNNYAFDTGDLPRLLGYLRGQYPTADSQAWGVLSRMSVPFFGYTSRMLKQMVVDPVKKGMIPLAKRAVGKANFRSDWHDEMAHASRPFVWLVLHSLLASGLFKLLPPPLPQPEEESAAANIQDAPGLDPRARTQGRMYIGADDNAEKWMSVKGLGQLETIDSIKDFASGRVNDIREFASEFLTLHPIITTVLNGMGIGSAYDAKIPFDAKLGRTLAQIIVPEFSRFGPDCAKLIRMICNNNTVPDNQKQNFFSAFFEQMGLPVGAVQYDRDGKLRTSNRTIEAIKMMGINVREIPFDIIENAAKTEMKRIEKDVEKLNKINAYKNENIKTRKPEREFLKVDLGSDFTSLEEAEDYYSGTRKRQKQLVDTAIKLNKKGYWSDPEEEAREKREERKIISDMKKRHKGKSKSRNKPKTEKPLLREGLDRINKNIQKGIQYNGEGDEYEELLNDIQFGTSEPRHHPSNAAEQIEDLLNQI